MFKPIERAAGDEDDIETGRERGLMGAKLLAQAALGASARHGVAHGGTGRDEARARGFGLEPGVGSGERRAWGSAKFRGRGAGRGCRRRGAGIEVGGRVGCGFPRWRPGAARGEKHGERAGVVTAAGGTDVVEIALAAQVLLGKESHGVGGGAGGGNGKAATEGVAATGNGDGRRGAGRRQLDDGEALAALRAAGGEDFAATLGGFAGAEVDLASALLLVWAEGGFHGVLRD